MNRKQRRPLTSVRVCELLNILDPAQLQVLRYLQGRVLDDLLRVGWRGVDVEKDGAEHLGLRED
jgi:hypothetical protein